MVAADVHSDEHMSTKVCDVVERFYCDCGGRFAEEHCYGDDASILASCSDDDDARSPSPITSFDSTKDDVISTQSTSRDDVSAQSRDDIKKDEDDEDDEDDDKDNDNDNDNDNDDHENGATSTVGDDKDSTVYMKPKKLSVEEMEALYLKAKDLLVLRKYPAFVEAVTDCQQLLSFQSTKHGDVTLLHLLSSQDVAPPEMYILQTISQDPSAVRLLDANGNSVLHLSAKALNASNLRVFLLFLKFCRGRAYQPNNIGDLPLHIVAATGSPGAEQAVTALVEANPTALTVRGARGKPPLHLALAEGSSNSKILVEILAAHKEKQISIVDLDDDGNTPLHSAIKYAASYDAISTFRDELKLEESFISPFITKNRNGDLPLHSALHLKDVDPRIISLLLDVAPYAGTSKDGRGKMPVELATAANLPVSLVIGILTLDMPIVIGNAGCIAKRQHGHSWWHVAIHANDKGKFTSGISDLLEMATPPELIGLARSVGPDRKTRTIDAASPELKTVFQEKLRFLGRYDISTRHLPYLRNGVQTYSATAIDLEDGENASTTLRCYSTLAPFLEEINVRKHYKISPEFVEDMKASFKANRELVPGSAQFIAFQKPASTLEEILETAPKERATLSWLTKCNSILKNVALALQDLHNAGLVHGHLEPATLGCFSYGETSAWKLMEIGPSTRIGSAMSRDSFSGFYRLSPPESIFGRAESDVSIGISNETRGQEQVPIASSTDVSESSLASSRPSRLLLRQGLKKKERELRKRPSRDESQRFVPENFLASPTWDAWAFGVIMAQMFVLHSSVLPGAKTTDELVVDHLSNFDAVDAQTIADEVRSVAGNYAANLVGRLLDPNPETRLHSMSKVLRHRYFHEPVCEPMKPIDPSATDKKAKILSRFGNRTKKKDMNG